MPVRSHVDFCTFVRTIHAHGRDVPAEVVALLDGRPDVEATSAAWARLHDHKRDIFFHEGYHVWQGARLPFVYWYGINALRSAVQLFRALDDIEDFEQWEAFVPSLYRLDLTWHAWWFEDGSIEIARQREHPPQRFTGEARLSVLDLLECATSLAQYQVTEGPERAVDARVFARWRKRRKAYIGALRFLAAYLGSETTALRALIPTVCRAFTTSDPVRAFFLLSKGLRERLDEPLTQQFLAQTEPCRWGEMLADTDERVLAPTFEAGEDASDDILEGPFCRLTLDGLLGRKLADGNPLEHPVLTPMARAWREAEAEDPGLIWLLEQPAWAGPERFERALNEFQPPVTLVRVQRPDGRGHVFSSSPRLSAPEIRELQRSGA